ncbi:zinc finger protein 518B [Erpetoichthys calabaricus]|uniref:zinc finger protein 518B n=1 Tax=Erpetoichthys calabaricus TaxID=27687 RepID=UPI002234A494|nr:zinc finger protein 518B [Erpetoichthys calabaricus]XP_051784168.1 zinc finger protein 518B [Erpetoichthys calabaricus]XP_051784169.1 zinc finger protein 518B [Erpetoichthys calabaricus]XP_051784171.1 zinc finger protein 518B [Erpetoichthys calabaricus]
MNTMNPYLAPESLNLEKQCNLAVGHANNKAVKHDGEVLTICIKCRDPSNLSSEDLNKHLPKCTREKTALVSSRCDNETHNSDYYNQRSVFNLHSSLATSGCNENNASSEVREKKHQGGRPSKTDRYQCNKCRFSSKDFQQFNKHILQHNEITFNCSYCNHISYTKGESQRHLVDHTGQFPFKCKFCDYGAVRHDYIVKHTQRVHGPTRRKKMLDDLKLKVIDVTASKCSVFSPRNVNFGNKYSTENNKTETACKTVNEYSATSIQDIRSHPYVKSSTNLLLENEYVCLSGVPSPVQLELLTPLNETLQPDKSLTVVAPSDLIVPPGCFAQLLEIKTVNETQQLVLKFIPEGSLKTDTFKDAGKTSNTNKLPDANTISTANLPQENQSEFCKSEHTLHLGKVLEKYDQNSAKLQNGSHLYDQNKHSALCYSDDSKVIVNGPETHKPKPPKAVLAVDQPSTPLPSNRLQNKQMVCIHFAAEPLQDSQTLPSSKNTSAHLQQSLQKEKNSTGNEFKIKACTKDHHIGLPVSKSIVLPEVNKNISVPQNNKTDLTLKQLVNKDNEQMYNLKQDLLKEDANALIFPRTNQAVCMKNDNSCQELRTVNVPTLKDTTKKITKDKAIDEAMFNKETTAWPVISSVFSLCGGTEVIPDCIQWDKNLISFCKNKGEDSAQMVETNLGQIMCQSSVIPVISEQDNLQNEINISVTQRVTQMCPGVSNSEVTNTVSPDNSLGVHCNGTEQKISSKAEDISLLSETFTEPLKDPIASSVVNSHTHILNDVSSVKENFENKKNVLQISLDLQNSTAGTFSSLKGTSEQASETPEPLVENMSSSQNEEVSVDIQNLTNSVSAEPTEINATHDRLECCEESTGNKIPSVENISSEGHPNYSDLKLSQQTNLSSSFMNALAVGLDECKERTSNNGSSSCKHKDVRSFQDSPPVFIPQGTVLRVLNFNKPLPSNSVLKSQDYNDHSGERLIPRPVLFSGVEKTNIHAGTGKITSVFNSECSSSKELCLKRKTQAEYENEQETGIEMKKSKVSEKDEQRESRLIANDKVAKNISKTQISFHLVPVRSDQNITCPDHSQPVVVLNHPELDTPEITSLMQTLRNNQDSSSNVALPEIVQYNPQQKPDTDAQSETLAETVEPVNENNLLKMKLRKVCSDNYQVVGSDPKLPSIVGFKCWFCARIFNNQDQWITHGQRHLTEATRDWNAT